MHQPPSVVSFDYDSLSITTALRLRQTVIDINEARSAAIAAIAVIGHHLIAVKDLLPHGRFTAWIAAEFGLTIRTATNHMSTARLLDGKGKCISDLPAHVVYRLAAPSAPPEIIDDVVAAAEAGAPLAVKEIVGRLDASAQRAREEPACEQAAETPEGERTAEQWEQVTVNVGYGSCLLLHTSSMPSAPAFYAR